MAKKKYWQSFTELNETEAHKKLAADEFREELPFETKEDDKSFTNASASRRDFLKYLGFSTAAAMAAASCETPVKKVIPYLNKPENLVPGVADYYATTYVSGGEAISVVAKVRDGRPIKLEGNTLSSYTKGGTSARVQAAVLDLYDTARLRSAMKIEGDNKTAISLEVADKEIAAGLASGNVVLLTSTINSASTAAVIAQFLAKYPGSRHVEFDAVSYSALIQANVASYGKQAIPSYQFDKAKVIVSLGADFLGTWLSPVAFAKQYAAGRKITDKNIESSKHYQFESMISMTGANADERYTHVPSAAGTVAAALLSAVQGQAIAGLDAKLAKGIKAAAASLLANKGQALVVSGSHSTEEQIIVNAINEVIGANGTTINWAAPLQTYKGIDANMEALVADMAAGKVNSLVVYGVNPAYEYYNAAAFNKALKSVKLTVSLNERLDETAELCKYAVPSNHFLESWGDATPVQGNTSFMQPTINPLFDTRQFQTSLLKWSGSAEGYDVFFTNYWTSILGGESAFNKALQDGVVETASVASGASYNASSVTAALASVASAKKSTGNELVIYQKVSLGDGKQANNPWLQELPDPITKATWDNYAMVSPQFGKEVLDIDISDAHQADDYDVNMTKPVVKFTVNGKEITLPVLIIPGMQANTIAVAVGFGRSEKTGLAANGVGQNAYPLLSLKNGNVQWTATVEKAEKTDIEYKVAQTQVHNSAEGRDEVVREITLDELKKNPKAIIEDRAHEIGQYGGMENYEKEGTLYPLHDRPGVKWGMSIDLSSCIGCGSCSVACTAENNVPVVGKNEVIRFHEMHWMRIDRYFSGDVNDADSIQTLFQPMLCQHCDNAPCENVCPVAATNHSSEGLNQMTYNRCIGTRYCANNCPFKVRRFNWLDYTGADSFKNNQLKEGVGALNDAVFMMNDDLTRMVLNPDVTVRSRGVIEKCSFCVQRLQEGKLKAKKENRVLADSDVKTACQQSCPSDAIVFGNVNNPESEINQVRKGNTQRIFASLEQIHVLPNVTYLAKVRNTEALSSHSGAEGHHEEAAAPKEAHAE